MYNAESSVSSLSDRLSDIFAISRAEKIKAAASYQEGLISITDRDRAIDMVDLCAQIEFEVAVLARVEADSDDERPTVPCPPPSGIKYKKYPTYDYGYRHEFEGDDSPTIPPPPPVPTFDQ